MSSPDRDRSIAWALEMRRVHDRLRDALALAREAAEDGRPPDPPDRDQLLHCWGFCLALSGHHRSEDEVLFPAALRADPLLREVIPSLRSDHAMIEHLLHDYRQALDVGDPDELLRHLDGISAVMETHFRYEEQRLLPLLERLSLDAEPASALGPLAD